MVVDFVADGKLTEDNQVLGDTGVNHVHGAHGAAGVVEDPFFVEVDVGAVEGGEGSDDVGDDGCCVVAVEGNGFLG